MANHTLNLSSLLAELITCYSNPGKRLSKMLAPCLEHLTEGSEFKTPVTNLSGQDLSINVPKT